MVENKVAAISKEDITRHSDILVIDDSMFILKSIESILKDDYNVRAATSADEAYEMLEKKLPDIILLDIEMPDVDGYDFLKRVKSTPEWEDVPVIFLTVLDDQSKEELALNLGAVDYIRKPIMPGILSRRIRLHLELQVYKKNLQNLVEQKTQQLLTTEKRLRKAVTAAEESSQAKSLFLAKMSHEIRTPMNSVLGMSELLLQEKLTKRQYRYVGDIKTSAMSLLDIINEILDVSKLQAGKFKLAPIHYDFNTLIENIESITRFLVANKSVAFKLLVKGDLPACLYGDDVRLRQVLLNLLSNAIKFTEEGYVRLTISFTDKLIKITVSDTGIGIAQETMPTLFEAFEQADIFANRSTGGTGLGLTITKAIVEMMDGRISVESVYGAGSSFHVEIPKILGDVTLIRQTEKDEAALYAPDAKVLVVDDNLINLNVAEGLLRLCHIKADTAASGKQAIEMVSKNKYDIVFMDHMMQGMDGVEATKIIRKLGIDVPIVALTATAIVGAKEMMLEAGMDDYLAKPIIKAELNSKLLKWIPSTKFLAQPPPAGPFEEEADESRKAFWEKVEQIEGLYVSVGLERVDGQWDVYEKTLRLMRDEIGKSRENLDRFLVAGDMENFHIEVHGIKSALANIGAIDLSAEALDLEIASAGQDAIFCAANLPALLNGLAALSTALNEAFAAIAKSDAPAEPLPPELPGIVEIMTRAFGEVDLVAIDSAVEKLDALPLHGAAKDTVERAKDAILIMDYDKATKFLMELLHDV